MNYGELIKIALEMRKKSYSPYSNFSVGAALITKDGKIYTGINIENAAYSPSICAERVAFSKAVSEGEREFSAIAIAGGDKNDEFPREYCMPCGVCRQTMAEFAGKDFEIITAKSVDDYKVFKLGEILPYSFSSLKNKINID